MHEWQSVTEDLAAARPGGPGAEIADLALWRQAREFVGRHGLTAPSVARRRAAAASFDGDGEGVRIWHGIAAIADRLLARPRRVR